MLVHHWTRDAGGKGKGGKRERGDKRIKELFDTVAPLQNTLIKVSFMDLRQAAVTTHDSWSHLSSRASQIHGAGQADFMPSDTFSAQMGLLLAISHLH